MSASDRLIANNLFTPSVAQEQRETLVADTYYKATPVDEVEEKPDPIIYDEPVSGTVTSGVIAATVSTNGLMPVSVYPGAWDVLACGMAYIDASFVSFKLPAPGYSIADYATGLAEAEFDETAIAAGSSVPARQNLRDVRFNESFMMQATAICDAEGLAQLALATGAAVEPLRWAGPFGASEAFMLDVNIADHVIPGANGNPDTVLVHDTSNVSYQVPDVLDVTMNTDMRATVDLTFLLLPGATGWTVSIVRIR
jgi:hypothetical protein